MSILGSVPNDLQDALLFAAERHKGQWRDGKTPLPYLTHVVEVVINLREFGGVEDPEMLIAAALHDTLEDTPTTAQEIESIFGARVAELVKGMTRKEPSAEQIQGLGKAELAELRDAMLLDEIRLMSPDVWQIKLADRLSNLSAALRNKSGKSLKRYLKHSRAILGIIPKSVNPGLWNEIDRLLP